MTVNDILFALVTGTLREYLIANDDLPQVPLRATCPVNIRRPAGKPGSGNYITTIWIDLPVHLSQPAERLLAVSASATAAKASLPESRASCCFRGWYPRGWPSPGHRPSPWFHRPRT